MSTGTNRERIEQNNLKLEEIKNQVSNLPEKVDYEEVYSKLDNGFNILEPINMSSKFSSMGFSMYNSVHQYRILNDKYIIVSFNGKQFNQYTAYYTYLIDLEQDISTEIFRCNTDNLYCMFLGETDENVYMAGQEGPTSSQYSFYLYTYNKATQSISSSTLYLYLDTGSTGRVYSNYTKVLDDYYLYWTGTSDYSSNYNLYRAKFDLQQLKFTNVVKINYTTGTGGRFKMTSPSIFCYGSTTTSTLDYNILKLINNDTDTIKGNIENLSGTDYFGAKAFANGNVYELNEDLTLGNLLAENAYDYSQGYITTLDEVHYKIGNYVYSFDEHTNTFTKIIENSVRNTDIQVYMYGKDGSDYKLTPISFLETTNSSNVIGTIVNGNFYSKPTIINLDNSKLLNGTSITAVNGVSYKGTMPNNGELNYTPSTEEQTIPAGYTSGGTVVGDSNLVANNIRLGTTIFGVEGNLEADKPDQTKTATPTIEEQVITPDTGYELASVTVEAVTSDIDSNIVAENIKKDVSILGVTGTLESSGSSDYNAKLVPTDGRITYYITEISTQLDTSSVINMFGMFNGCTNLTTIPLLDTSRVTDMRDMFFNCTSLTTIPLLDTSSVTNMQNMFYGCTNLTTIPQLDTSSVINMFGMFNGCTNLTTIPLLDTSRVTDMTYMVRNCTNLTTIPLLDTSKANYMSSIFDGCPNLSDESLNNILVMCTNATSYTGTKTLKHIGLTSAQATKCTTLSNYSAFTSAGWTTGY